MRKFSTGATRDDDEDKLNYLEFTAAICRKRYAEYMHEHRKQADGKMRSASNWKKGMPRQKYMESGYRHMEELAGMWEELALRDVLIDKICAIRFNLDGLMYELLLGRDIKEEEKVQEHPPIKNVFPPAYWGGLTEDAKALNAYNQTHGDPND